MTKIGAGSSASETRPWKGSELVTGNEGPREAAPAGSEHISQKEQEKLLNLEKRNDYCYCFIFSINNYNIKTRVEMV